MDVIDSLALFVNIVLLSFPNFESDLINALARDSIGAYKLSEVRTGEWLLVWKEDLYPCDEFAEIDLSPQCHRALCGVHWNFLTKKLTALNLEQWYKRRRAAYARSCLADEEDPSLAELRPDLGYVSRVNSSMAAGFHLKRQIFLSIRATSQMETHPLTGISKITMQYFSMAELTGFATAYDYIIVKNPILLSWNGLGKYTPYLLAAINAFRKMGEDGPYCKFLYPSEKLGAFHSSKIGIFTAVAAEISILEILIYLF